MMLRKHDAKCRRLFLGVAWLGAVGAVALASTVVVAGANAQTTSCSSARHLPNSDKPRRTPPTLSAADGAGIVMRFDDSLARDSYFVPLSLYADLGMTSADFVPPNGFDVLFAGGYLRRDAGHRIAPYDDGVKVTLIPVTPRRLDLCLAVDPSQIRGLAPGTYRGTAAVVWGSDKHPGIGPRGVDVPCFALVRDRGRLRGRRARSRREGVVGRGRESTRRDSAASSIEDYVSRLTFPAMLILAAVAGLLAFLQMYGGSPDWGASDGDTPLFALCFIAQMSTNEGIDVTRVPAAPSPAFNGEPLRCASPRIRCRASRRPGRGGQPRGSTRCSCRGDGGWFPLPLRLLFGAIHRIPPTDADHPRRLVRRRVTLGLCASRDLRARTRRLHELPHLLPSQGSDKSVGRPSRVCGRCILEDLAKTPRLSPGDRLVPSSRVDIGGSRLPVGGWTVSRVTRRKPRGATHSNVMVADDF